ncbi:MAG: Asp-tRNA(Asn)/Glu-tRNA(Gln) amidotransferase subunit GatA [Spirochaetota bacterium]|nr:MAG: Asp-tRNA(Asn)/Glu-tRNA(Gln) amidotransferase subunit GatA [Spirochaetota bacterium]
MGLNECTLVELTEKLRIGEITTSDIIRDIESAITQDEGNKYPLNAYTSFDIESIEKEIKSQNKKEDTLLKGVPIAIKDIINVMDTPTTCGSGILKDYISPYDATAIKNLRKNGGVPAGKLNMDEFAMGSSNENSYFGVVRNPHDRKKIPGGSSGGAAAAVSANLAVAALASDTGGSIRQPASMCGIFGIKPTYGRVSRFGLIAYASSFDQIGPITNTVMDGAILLDAVSGYDPKDSTSANEKVPCFRDFVGKGLGGLRIGIPEEYFGEGLNSEVRDIVERGIKILSEANASVKRIALKYTRYAIACYYIIATAEASSNLARFDGIRYGTRFVDTEDLETLYRENRNIGFGDEVKRRILLGTFALSSGYYDAYYLKAQRARTLIREDFKEAFREVDIIVTPVSPIAAWDIGELIDDPLQMYLSDVYTVPVNLAGLPAASVPCGKTKDRLPVGVQLIADHFNEADIFRVARIIEEGEKGAE